MWHLHNRWEHGTERIARRGTRLYRNLCVALISTRISLSLTSISEIIPSRGIILTSSLP